MDIQDAVVLVTGANRGIGLAFAREALARGARKVYAAARNPATVTLPGAVPVKLDVNDAAQVDAAARDLGDVTLLVNNAGIATVGGFLADDGIEQARAMLETNFFGPLRLSRAFAPVLARHGGGAILNVLSVATWLSSEQLAVYAASKSAAWGLTNALRLELQGQRTQVVALHVGFVDTDLTRGLDVPKIAPEAVACAGLDGVAAGAREVLADEVAQAVHRGLAANPPVYLQPLAR
jgi:NAD(P)-dependent dehydrogenase (short-subunit alcohol dehydrogenase family)